MICENVSNTSAILDNVFNLSRKRKLNLVNQVFFLAVQFHQQFRVFFLELVNEVEAFGQGFEESVDLLFEVVSVDCVFYSSDGEFYSLCFFLQFFHHFLVLL
jgi:hypothetical protein